MKTALFLSILTLCLFVTQKVSAAAPDGAGPWADSVVSSSQGTTKAGAPVPVIRSDTNAALGVAEDNTTDGNFFSLGFGGQIVLHFDNGIGSEIKIWEATNEGYPVETALVEFSNNGISWTNAGSVAQDGQVQLPQSLNCAYYVRISDTSDTNNFSDGIADGYDVDGVQLTGSTCTTPTPVPTPTPTPSPTPNPTPNPTPTPTPCGQNCGCTDVTQNNFSSINNLVSVYSNTGNNKLKKNTGGVNTIVSGNNTSIVTISNVGGSNYTNATACCQTHSDTKVVIKNNGAGSKNKVKINN